jgi:parallel beta-helix repeat protein
VPLPSALRLTSLVAAVALAACSDSEEKTTPCDGVSGNCVAFEAGSSADSIADAMASATAGTTFAFGAGTFAIDNSLDVTAAGVTIRGAGRDATVLDFTGQAGSEGILATGDDFTIRDLTVQDTAGNGIKVVGADGVTFKGVKVTWTDPDLTTHGPYGLYPVSSRHVLVEDCFVSGSNDAGIYVGQSQDIIVRNSEATGNVAGVEIENSYRADVHGNHVHGNTGGVLVFDLPGLPQQGGHHVRVFDNVIVNNNHANFADPAGIVAITPAGSGVIVMANHDVEIFGNTIQGNQTVAFGIVSYALTGGTIPEGYDPFPRSVFVHDNVLSQNGTAPDTSTDLGLVLAGIQDGIFSGNPLPDFIWDGISYPGTDPHENVLGLCVESPASWLSLGTGFDENGPTFAPWTAEGPTFRCSHEPLSAVAPW